MIGVRGRRLIWFADWDEGLQDIHGQMRQVSEGGVHAVKMGLWKGGIGLGCSLKLFTGVLGICCAAQWSGLCWE